MKISASKIEDGFFSYNRQRTFGSNALPAFSGQTKLTGDILEKMKGNMGKVPRFLFWIEKLKGENINAIITALGTAFVAPIFIRFNPLSKSDDETKAYSAWRQPISAAIQFGTALSVLLPFNHWLDRRASAGNWEVANLKAKPTKYIAEKIVRLEHPEYNKEQVEVAIAEYQDKRMRKAVDEARVTMKDKVITDDMLVGRTEFEDSLKKIRELPENKKLSSQELKEKALDMAKKNVLDKLDMNAETKARLRSYNDGVNTVDTAITKVQAELQKVSEKVQAEIKAAGVKTEAELPLAGAKREKEILSDVLRRLEITKDYEAPTKMHPFSSLKDLGSTKEKIMANLRIKKYVQAAADRAEFSLSRLRMWAGMGVALVMLVPSCYLLNYAYPRIMEKIMPHASKKKQQAQQVQQPPISKETKEVK